MYEEINEYQKWTETTAAYPKDKEFEYLTLGLASEAGEVAGKVKKIIRDKNSVLSDEDKGELGKELGDVCWYLARLTTYFDLDLSDIFEANQYKLEKRKAENKIKGSGDNR